MEEHNSPKVKVPSSNLGGRIAIKQKEIYFMVDVGAIMLCENIQDAIKKQNWVLAKQMTEMLGNCISQHEQASNTLAEKEYETISIDNKSGSA